MKKTSTKTTFRMNGWIYTYNEPMTSNWGWPEGRKGERVRILKKDMLQLLKERDAFNTPYTEEPETKPAQETAEADQEPADEATGLCISLLCKMSREAKRVTAKEAEVENEKYAFRCFLLRLGFIGNEYKGMRKVLLRRLSGSAAFVTKDKADAFSAVQKAKRDAAKNKEV